MRSREPSRTEPTRADLVRQVAVLIGGAVAIAGGFLGSGAAGGQGQQEVGGGVLAPDATPVAPGETAFSIWSVIYTGLVVYAIWQVLPSQRSDARQRRVGWWVLGSMVLNALWILVVQVELLWLSVPVIVVLLATLLVIMARLLEQRSGGPLEAVVVDGTLGLYLGWVVVATIANIAALVTAEEVGTVSDAWAVVALVVAGAAGASLAVWTGGRLAIGAAIVWGLVWIVVARTAGDLESVPAGVTAGIAAAVVLVATVWLRARRPGREDAGPATAGR